MAGEWIKVENSTPEKPEVLRLARILAIDPAHAFGCLLRVWCWFDRNSVVGSVDGVVSTDVDAIARKDGFAVAMRDVGWLKFDDEKQRVALPRFDRHNGETAKKRILRNERQSRWRSKTPSTDAPTNSSTREEKRRDTTPIPPSGAFLRFWATWPKHQRKQAQGKCWERWRKQDLDQVADEILAHVEALKLSIDWRKENGKFIPSPAVYVNERRWEGAEMPVEVQEQRRAVV